jgi:opacity protein-like surface antigen
MVKRIAVVAALAALLASPVFAQDPRVEVGALFGYTLSEGVPIQTSAVNGVVYSDVDPVSSMSYGVSFGVFATPAFEIEFMWSRQPTELQVSGTGAALKGDMNIDTYHGNFVYNLGGPEAMVRPFAFVGLGATNYSDAVFPAKTVPGMTKFSWALGAGVKAYPTRNLGVKAMVRWMPTYIKTDGYGWWCDPYWGCYPVGDAQYANSFEMAAGVTLRF